MRVINFDYPIIQKSYKTVSHRDLSLYIFCPEESRDLRPAILFFNGGSFNKGPHTPAQFQHQAHYFSSIGLVAICVDYRNGHDEGFVPEQAICDVKSAVRWVRDNHDVLGVDPNRIIICGASAGGYISVSSIMFPEIDDEENITDHVPDALIVYAGGMDAIDIMNRLFPERVEIAESMSPIHHIRACLPSTLWMCGTKDILYEQNIDFTNRMRASGNEIEWITYEGMEHGFFNYGKHDNIYFDRTMKDMESFLRGGGYIK